MEFTLDIKKWVCGRPEHPSARVGVGRAALLNSDGYQCCVGQFAEQCGVTKDLLYNHTTISSLLNNPENITKQTKLRRKLEVFHDGDSFSSFTGHLYGANDQGDALSVQDRIKRIRSLLAEHGHTLTVINEELIPDESIPANC